MTTTAAAEFYDHKRQEHKGDYDSRCATCQRLYEEMVAASRAQAGVKGEA